MDGKIKKTVSIYELQDSISYQVSKLSRVKILLKNHKFVQFWYNTTDEMKQLICKLAKEGNRDEIYRLMIQNYHESLEQKSSTELKDIAQTLYVRNYSRLTKIELLVIIKEILDDRETKIKKEDDQKRQDKTNLSKVD